MLNQVQEQETIHFNEVWDNGMVHDVNNILAAVVGYIEVAKIHLDDPNMARRDLDEAMKAADKAKNLLRQSLPMKREIRVSNSRQEFAPAIHESIKMIRPLLPENVEIHCDLDATGAVSLTTEQIGRVVMNLCTNAIQAMEPAGGVLKISLGIVSIPDEYMVITVSDTGKGISQEIMDQIFDPYFMTKENGTGLGLAVINGFVKEAGGFVVSGSREGEGSTFSVYLPRYTPASKVPLTGLSSKARRDRGKILFVDDEHCILDLAKTVMGDQGYTVVVADNGQKALDAFMSEPGEFSAVVSDIALPEMDGEELARRIRDVRPDLPIIMCTGYCDEAIKRRLCEIGVHELVMKPFLMNEMVREIQGIIAGDN